VGPAVSALVVVVYVFRMSSDKVLAAVVVVVAQVVNLLLSPHPSSPTFRSESPPLPTCPSPSVVFCPPTPCRCLVESSSPSLLAAAGPFLFPTLLLLTLAIFALGVRLGLAWRFSPPAVQSQVPLKSASKTSGQALKAEKEQLGDVPSDQASSGSDSSLASETAVVAARAQAQVAALLARRRRPA
jgi:hypothetical protein